MAVSARRAFFYNTCKYITNFILRIIRFCYSPLRLLGFLIFAIPIFFIVLYESYLEQQEVLIGVIICHEELQHFPLEARVQLALEHILGDQFMPQGNGLPVENIRVPRARPMVLQDPFMPRVYHPNFEVVFFNRPAPIPRYLNFRLARDHPGLAPDNLEDIGIRLNPLPFVILLPELPMQDRHRDPDNNEFRAAEEGNLQLAILNQILPNGQPDRNLLIQRRRQSPGV